MKILRNITYCLAWMSIMMLVTTSCKEYNDDLQELGKRVETLETKVLEFNKTIGDINAIVTVLQGYGRISKIEKKEDGNGTYYEITIDYLDENGEPIPGKTRTHILRNGRQGADMNSLIGVTRNPEDGLWYWTLNGEPLLDAQGKWMRAGAVDGKSASEVGVVIPVVRINYSNNPPKWEVSYDNGITWIPTNIPANGNNGEDDLVQSVEFNGDGTITIIFKGSNTKYIINYDSVL